jgi:hypothetical protein
VTLRGGKEAWIGPIVVLGSNINERRCIRHPDEA